MEILGVRVADLGIVFFIVLWLLVSFVILPRLGIST